MFRNRIGCLIVVFLFHLLPTAILVAQEDQRVGPREILDRYIEALGGEMMLLSIETLQVDLALRDTDTDFFRTFSYKDEKKVITTSNSEYRSCFQGKTVSTTFDGIEVSKSSYTLSLAGGSINTPLDALMLSKWTDQMTVVSKDEIAESPWPECRSVEHVFEDKIGRFRWFFDQTSGLLLGIERPHPSDTQFLSYKYTEIEGVQFVSEIKIAKDRKDGKEHVFVFENFRINQPISDELFDFIPSSGK